MKKNMNKATVYLIKNEQKKYFLTLQDSSLDWFLFKLKSFEQDLINDILKCDTFKTKTIEFQINITLYENGIQTKTKTRLAKLLSGAILKEGF